MEDGFIAKPAAIKFFTHTSVFPYLGGIFIITRLNSPFKTRSRVSHIFLWCSPTTNFRPNLFLKKYRVKVNIDPVSLYCIYSCSVISNCFQVQGLSSSCPLSITALQKIYLFPFSREHHTRAFYKCVLSSMLSRVVLIQYQLYLL